VFAIEHELDAWMQQTQTQLCRPLHANGDGDGDGDGVLITRIQELEEEVRELREQIAAVTAARRFVPEAHAA
jgi:hypothetical protein